MTLTWNITYEIVTPESAADGDVEDRGFEEEDCIGDIESLISDIERYGCLSHNGSWFESVDPVQDHAFFTRGEEKRHTVHISGVTPETENRIIALVEARGK